MPKWKGPVECARCKGLTLTGEEHLLVARPEQDDKGLYHSLYPYGDRCRGPFTPHDRRAPGQSYRDGIAVLRDAAIADWSPGTVYSRETVRTWLEGVAARVEGGKP